MEIQIRSRLITTFADAGPEPWPVHFVYTSSRAMPLKLRAFLEFAKPRIQSILNEPIER
jgi:DNA-binding transcriptional LysR family regulator